MKKPVSVHILLLVVTALLLLSVVLPLTHAPHQVAAQVSAPTIELAYDDGTAWKTIRESVGGCPECHLYQGVRFDIGGAPLAVVTSVRFYAAPPAGTLEIFVTDETAQSPLFDPIKVDVFGPGWYSVSVPETIVTGDFYVWVKTDGDAMPYHDAGTAVERSYFSEHYNPDILTAPNQRLRFGDLMIRVNVRAEIHVGEGQDYTTIQQAVDAAGEGLTIVVHQGDYPENVVVDKKLSIISRDGPSDTVVTAQNPGASTFTVTANGVTISGFSIQGASGVGAAAVHIDHSSDSRVAGNTISGNYYGLLISAASRDNLVVDNDIYLNNHGVWVEGEKNNISGNRIDGNTASLGSDVYLSDAAVDNRLHFNSFSPAPGMEQVPQVYNDSVPQKANCVNNWWGSATGPHHSVDNPAGTGAAIGDDILFNPWLKAETVAVKTAATPSGSYLLNARTEASASVVKAGTGTPTVWVARYAANPGGEFPQTPIGNWIDVYFSNTTNVDQVEIRMHYTQAEIANLNEGSLRLYWWNGTEWKVCSQGGVNTTDGFVWARLDPRSTPSLAHLHGTPFVIGTTTASFAWWWILIAIAVLIIVVIVARLIFRALPRSQYYE